jgi:hypothetical protein
MKTVMGDSKLLAALFFGFVLLLALPAVSIAQGRGRGRGRGYDWDNNKKCAKFVNCHDARDGRWDGRGPNSYRRNGNFLNRGDRVEYRNRSYSTNDYWRRRHSTYRRNSDMNWRYRSYRRRF